jgi:hypothetical protein
MVYPCRKQVENKFIKQEQTLLYVTQKVIVKSRKRKPFIINVLGFNLSEL